MALLGESHCRASRGNSPCRDYVDGTAFVLHPERMDESPDPSMAEPQGSGGAPWLRAFGEDGEKQREEAQRV